MNELTLCIVNEGVDYQRCRVARVKDPVIRFAHWADRIAIEARAQRRAFEQEFTVEQMAQAVVELDDYYQRHIAEM